MRSLRLSHLGEDLFRRSAVSGHRLHRFRVAVEAQEHGPQKPHLRSQAVGGSCVSNEQAVENHHASVMVNNRALPSKLRRRPAFIPTKKKGY